VLFGLEVGMNRRVFGFGQQFQILGIIVGLHPVFVVDFITPKSQRVLIAVVHPNLIGDIPVD
jgi:hypothetical protein